MSLYLYISDYYVSAIRGSRRAGCVSANAWTSFTAPRGQLVAPATPRDGDAAILCHIDARAATCGHTIIALHMDGGVAARDVDGIAACHRDMGITQIDSRIAACHADAIAARAVEIIVSVGGNRISLCPL